MIRTLSLPPWVTLLVATPLLAQNEPPKRRGPSPADQEIAQLLEACENSTTLYPKRHAEFEPKFRAFAKEHRGTEAGMSAELWLLQGCWWDLKSTATKQRAVEIAQRILEYNFHSKQLDALLDFGHLYPSKAREIYSRVLSVSKYPEIRGAAHLALGRLLSAAEDDATRKAGAEHLKTIQAKYPGIPYRGSRLGALAAAVANPPQDVGFAIGKRAPEIVGVDLFGKPMRLSDYRGKIVVLDFWGDW